MVMSSPFSGLELYKYEYSGVSERLNQAFCLRANVDVSRNVRTEFRDQIMFLPTLVKEPIRERFQEARLGPTPVRPYYGRSLPCPQINIKVCQ